MSSSLNSSSSKIHHLLVVDDEPTLLRILQVILTRAKYRVELCSTAKDALLALSKTPFDLVITDAMMPEMSGYDLAKAIRTQKAFQVLPILMLTGKKNRQDIKKALNAGVTDYVMKPVDEPLLLEKLKTLLRDSQDSRGKNTPS